MHPSEGIRELLIVGGGTAGWMTAAALSSQLSGRVRIRLVESEEIGTIGVGEATIPMLQRFNAALGLDENAFLREAKGTFKLGIEFDGWGRPGEAYMHGFGRIGQNLGTMSFDKYWLKQRGRGRAGPLGDYTLTTRAAYAGKFMRPVPNQPNSPLGDIAYAFHFDASLYARFLRRYAEARGVQRHEGKIRQVQLHPESGFVQSVQLESGESLAADFFIDCSGLRGLLIEDALQAGYETWTDLLPCDRAMAVPCESAGAPKPYTRAIARKAGWQWRIPLQHRIGNGLVYSSQHLSDDEAAHLLLGHLDGAPLADPRPLRFSTGMRRKTWVRNVVAVGLSSGFMEPLESTSIHLIQTAIARILEFFPDQGFAQADVDEYNRLTRQEYLEIRDFLVLHYHQNGRDEPFWQACRALQIPDSLRRRIELFRSRGRIIREGNELFTEVSWLQVMMGQGLRPASYPALVDLLPEAELDRYIEDVGQVIGRCVEAMPAHADFIRQYCAAP